MTSRIWNTDLYPPKRNGYPRAKRALSKPAPRLRPHPMTDEQARQLCLQWWGKTAEAAMSLEEGEPLGVGYWTPDQSGDPFGHYICVGIGDTWEEAFRDADPKRWKAHVIEQRSKAVTP